MPNIESGIALLIQIPLVGIFIWYSITLWKMTAEQQGKFMEALDKRDAAFEKRNNVVCENLEKLANSIDRTNDNIDSRLTQMQIQKSRN